MRASANVIHPRSSGGNADKERASVASVVPSSFMISDEAAASAPNSHLMRLIIPILEVSCCPGAASGSNTAATARHDELWVKADICSALAHVGESARLGLCAACT